MSEDSADQKRWYVRNAGTSSEPTFIHPTADVSPLAKIGAGTQVWNWSQIRERAVIGRDTIIGQMTYIGVEVVIGDRCRVMPKTAIDTGTVIGSDVFIGPHCLFPNDTTPRAWSTRDMQGVRWYVEDGVSFAADVIVLPDVSVGHHAFVAVRAIVNKDVPPHALMIGTPARRHGWVSTAGHPMHMVRETDAGDLYVCPRTGEEVLILQEWKEGRWRPAALKATARS